MTCLSAKACFCPALSVEYPKKKNPTGKTMKAVLPVGAFLMFGANLRLMELTLTAIAFVQDRSY